jgi:hypothetical protein
MSLTVAKIGRHICTPVHIAEGKVIPGIGETIFGAETAGEKVAGANVQGVSRIDGRTAEHRLSRGSRVKAWPGTVAETATAPQRQKLK